MLTRVLDFLSRNGARLLGLIPFLVPALSGLRHLFQHEPLRLLYVAGVAISAAYAQLSTGLALDHVALAVAALVLEELGRSVVTSPATADALHQD